MPEIRPFRALRYSAEAGPLQDLVAPPYDVISPQERERYLARSPYNVVHLTLPDSEEQAASDLEAWRRDGVLVEEEPAVWWVAQDYTGPDGIERTREGFAASLRVEPYETGAVLPHERTHAGPKEGRLRLLRATRTELEPIFLLYDAEPPVARPERAAALEAEEGGVRTRLWKLPGAEPAIDVPLLIADGHHRYETALAFSQEDPSATHMLVVLVSSRAPGLVIFPTHRLVRRLGEVPVSELADLPDPLPGPVLYRDGRYWRIETDEEIDAEAVAKLDAEVVGYAPVVAEAVAAVDRGEAEAAFLLRPVSVEQVAARAAAGGVMPQKTTFFYPKLL
ncbi:MAG TPA: DUF1015 domain-containing protein, partial [Gaiellaceae bacterium]